jgi:hypothetical protein
VVESHASPAEQSAIQVMNASVRWTTDIEGGVSDRDAVRS